MKHLSFLLMLVASLTCGACASMYIRGYPDTHPCVYPGVRCDAEIISYSVAEDPAYLPLALISLLDMPFSAVFETILFPYDWTAQHRYHDQ